jgi:hypothetical protein
MFAVRNSHRASSAGGAGRVSPAVDPEKRRELIWLNRRQQRTAENYRFRGKRQ